MGTELSSLVHLQLLLPPGCLVSTEQLEARSSQGPANVWQDRENQTASVMQEWKFELIKQGAAMEAEQRSRGQEAGGEKQGARSRRREAGGEKQADRSRWGEADVHSSNRLVWTDRLEGHILVLHKTEKTNVCMEHARV